MGRLVLFYDSASAERKSEIPGENPADAVICITGNRFCLQQEL